MFILTIYFIVLNVYVEFVLIYRPHPVSVRYLKTVISKKNFETSWRSLLRRAGSGSISQSYCLDPYQNVTDPEHWTSGTHTLILSPFTASILSKIAVSCPSGSGIGRLRSSHVRSLVLNNLFLLHAVSFCFCFRCRVSTTIPRCSMLYTILTPLATSSPTPRFSFSLF
jgi:hypothetical protein